MREIKQFFSMGLIAKNKVWFILLLAVIFTACTTQKKKGEATKFQKFYQNTTTEFNYYFNANVLLEEAIVKLDESHQDNYNKFLPVYKYVDSDNPTAAAGGLDDAVKKVTVAKTLHPESHWLDDCYLLAGKAQYVKQDYESAEETLIFVSREFSPEAMEEKEKKNKKKASGKKKKRKKKKRRKKKKKKKRKKPSKKKKASSKKKATPKSDDAKKDKKSTKVANSDEKPDKYLIKHRPAHQEGLLWLARTYIERDAFEEAEVLIDRLENDPKTFKDIRKQLAPVKAHFYMTQKNYEAAVAPLEEAVASHKKDEKARYAYILGQIHDWAGRGDQAYAYYEQAMKASRSYEMEFSSRLNLAQNGYKSGKISADETLKALRKMSKDFKNEEYRDQIYFAMANISMKSGERDQAIGYLKKSLLYSTGNTAQKAESYLMLAQYYFESEDFVNAKNYYDSTLVALPNTDERYVSVSRYSNNLTDIAKNIEIITLQDSLLMVAAMSDSEKRDLGKRIKKQREAERREALLAKDVKTSGKGGRKAPNTVASTRPGRGGNAFTKSTFPFYDDRSKKKGAKDFDKQWGSSRKLEDNWRRSKRQGAGSLDETIAEEEVIEFTLTDEELAEILKDIPNSPEKMAKANMEIEEAMFRLGILYRDRLQNNLKSVETLEEMLKRYPDTKHEEEALYHLYLAYTDLGETGKAKVCYDKLNSKYGDGTFARVISDPNFLDQMKKEEQKLTIYYNDTYDEFSDGKYQSAYDRTIKVNTIFGPKNIYKAKFALLSAMCLGNIEGKEAYIKGLKEVVAKYPDTPEQTRAKEILRLLGQGAVAATNKNGKDVKTESKSTFKVDDGKLHYFIVALIGDNDIKLSDAKNAASDYNREYHKLDKLRISNVYLDTNNGTPVLVIRRFKTKEKAMTYYSGIAANKDDFLPNDVSYVMYPITQYNYRLILKQKSLDGYQEFFEENYQ